MKASDIETLLQADSFFQRLGATHYLDSFFPHVGDLEKPPGHYRRSYYREGKKLGYYIPTLWRHPHLAVKVHLVKELSLFQDCLKELEPGVEPVAPFPVKVF